MISCFRDTRKKFLYISVRFKKQVDNKLNKVDVLKIQWEIIKSDLLTRKNEINVKLMTIPDKIRLACLRGYITKCREIYTIAVLQHIRMFPSTISGINHTTDEQKKKQI